jgi:LmbE family N-acetylglucosaminyl deacetylase
MTSHPGRSAQSDPEGLPRLPTSSRLVVISPHLDDGVLGCGDLLAENPGGVMVTVFAGQPPRYPPLTSWDERGGFEEGADVVAVRREEDRRALTALGARPVWLPFPDPQYGSRPNTREVADALIAALDEIVPDAVAMPLGIFHDDHILAGDAAIDALGRRPSWAWLVYADAIYRRVPDLVDRRLQQIGGLGLTLRELAVAGVRSADLKRRAVACYESQVRALERSWDGGASDAFEPERYWQIVHAAARPTGSDRPAERA